MSMTTLNISLPEPVREFLETQAASAGYEKVDDYVLALIQEAQRREAERTLDTKLLEGLDSGAPIEVDDGYWRDLNARVAARLAHSTKGV
jgi:antitoxin ParD1/3/4